MIDFSILKHRREIFARVTGVKLGEFYKIVEKVSPIWNEQQASKMYPGRTHDFKIRKLSDHIPKDVIVLVDSGYQGLQKLHKNTILPYKRRRKTPLSQEQKQHNHDLAKSYPQLTAISRKNFI